MSAAADLLGLRMNTLPHTLTVRPFKFKVAVQVVFFPEGVANLFHKRVRKARVCVSDLQVSREVFFHFKHYKQ